MIYLVIYLWVVGGCITFISIIDSGKLKPNADKGIAKLLKAIIVWPIVFPAGFFYAMVMSQYKKLKRGN